MISLQLKSAGDCSVCISEVFLYARGLFSSVRLKINPGSLSEKNKGKNKLFKFYEEIVYCN